MIILDVGNSSVGASRWWTDDQTSPRPDAMPLEPLGTRPTPRDEAARAVLLKEIRAMRSDDESVALVSVVPDVTAEVTAALAHVTVIDHRSPLPFTVDLADPAAAGADRYANLAAAAAMGWTSALVVDVGTATTFDVLEDGVFVGGLIAPGPAFAARALGEHGARLAPVPFAPCPLEPGADTDAAMAAGAFHVGVQGVLGVVRSLQEGREDRPLVVTGGLAEALKHPAARPGLPPGTLTDRLWTHKGAALLAR